MAMIPTTGRMRVAVCAIAALTLLAVAGCADFSSEASTFTVQPSLTAPGADPRDPTTELVPPTPSPSGTTEGTPPSTNPSGSVPPTDPCAPTDDAVIATCLAAPWGLAPLPDGISALVGERTTGRILRVERGVEPELVAQIDGIDATGDGGLLGIALSPSYDEDGLLYAYVTTPEDNRIIRIARGDVPKPIFTGIPKGAQHNGGRLAFASDRTLYVGTGDTGTPAATADPAALAGKVLRLDEFGRPAADNPTPGSAVYARGFTQVAGLCPLEDGRVAALDHRDGQDLLFPLAAAGDYTRPQPGDALWTWQAADGGAADCAVDAGILATTSLDKQQLTGIEFGPSGTFTGTPQQILDNRYGRLLTVAPNDQGLLWLTTSNKDGMGTPVPSDDRVVVVPSGSAGGEGGPD
jgi:hypothetical protein